MFSEEKKIRLALKKYAHLPGGCKLYKISVTGRIFVAGNGAVKEIQRNEPEYANSIHTFINEGNVAHYLVGSPDTSQTNPSNATVKMIMMEPHNHFLPHSHGTEHFIMSQGYAGCLLYFGETRSVFPVFLQPGMLIYLSPMIPHAFFNRSNSQFMGLVSNTGLGINSEEYAITSEKAARFAEKESDLEKKKEFLNIQKELIAIEEFYATFNIPGSLSGREKIARSLQKIAEIIAIS